MLSAIQASVLQIIVTAGSVAVALGAFTNTTEQIIVSAAGTVIGAVVNIILALERKNETALQAATIVGSPDRLARARLGAEG
jgi:hypothetical protein